MEASLKQIDGRLILFVNPRTAAEQQLLEEFMQQEIPGHQHYLDYKKTTNGAELNFRPRLSMKNLRKEGFDTSSGIRKLFQQEIGLQKSMLMAMKNFNSVKLFVNSFGGYHYKHFDGTIIKGRFKDLIEMRQYIAKNEKLWRTWQF